MNPHLTKPEGDVLNAMMQATKPGMAFWAGSGPEGETCRTCAHWQGEGYRYDKNGHLRNRRCRLYTRLMRGVAGDAVPPETAACREHEKSDEAPALTVPPMIAGSNIRDTTIPGLKIWFNRSRSCSVGAVIHSRTGKIVIDWPEGKIQKIGRREFVFRVNASRLTEIDWTAPGIEHGEAGSLLSLANEARRQIYGEVLR